jgi:hypothetical protein
VELAGGDDIPPGKKNSGIVDDVFKVGLKSIFRCLLVEKRVTHWLTRDSELELRINPSVTLHRLRGTVSQR